MKLPKKFVIKRQPMKSGQAEAEIRVYDKYVGKSGNTWLVAVQDDCADNIYVTNNPDNTRGQGFGGATLHFTLRDGSVFELHGGWHTNSDALFSDTGVDIRNKYMTFVVVSKRIKYTKENWMGTMLDILYIDKEPMIGTFDRGTVIAKVLANKLNTPVYLYSQSTGGSSSGFVNPDKEKLNG